MLGLWNLPRGVLWLWNVKLWKNMLKLNDGIMRDLSLFKGLKGLSNQGFESSRIAPAHKHSTFVAYVLKAVKCCIAWKATIILFFSCPSVISLQARRKLRYVYIPILSPQQRVLCSLIMYVHNQYTFLTLSRANGSFLCSQSVLRVEHHRATPPCNVNYY